MIGGWPGLLVALCVGLAGAAIWLRFRSLERRLASLEQSLGALATLGEEAEQSDSESILKQLLALNDSLLQELKQPSTPSDLETGKEKVRGRDASAASQ